MPVNSKGRKSRWWILILLVALVGGGFLVFASLNKNGTRIEASKIARVERGDLARSVVATGKIEPITKVEIKSKASGIIQNLLVNVGDIARMTRFLWSSTASSSRLVSDS
jgi:HlyD family secretion protein